MLLGSVFRKPSERKTVASRYGYFSAGVSFRSLLLIDPPIRSEFPDSPSSPPVRASRAGGWKYSTWLFGGELRCEAHVDVCM